MPILLPPDVPAVPNLPVPPVLDQPRFTWTSPDGRVTPLDDWAALTEGTMTLPGVLGLHMPHYTVYEDLSPAFDGATVRGTPRANPRDITIPIHIWGPDRATCLARWRRLIFDLNPQNGPGTLTITERDGASRSIQATYSQGLEGADDDSQVGMHHMTYALVLHAPRPYWLGSEQTVTFKIAAVGDTFLPFLPLQVTDSAPGGPVTLTNRGDTDTFPVWTITGPCSHITLTNRSTGKSMEITTILTAADVAVIDTRDARKFVTLNGITNLWPQVTLGSDLWPLRAGANDLLIALSDSAPATTVQLAYQERFLTAY